MPRGFFALGVVWALQPAVYAQGKAVGCICYCGKQTDPPCSEEKCKQACASSNASAPPIVQGDTGQIDFSGVWKNPFERCAYYKFIVVENDLAIRIFCPNETPETLFARATLNGRRFTGKIDTTPHPDGSSYVPGTVEGRISDDNKIIYLTTGGRYPKNEKLIRE